MPLTDNDATKIFTPSEKEQAFLILQGKCPHNVGWMYWSHNHNDDNYRCIRCGEWREY